MRAAACATAEEAVAAVIATTTSTEKDENIVTEPAVQVVHHHHALPSHLPAAPPVDAVREQIAEHAEPLQVADIFCPDTEYNRAVLPSHHAIPQLDGLSAHGHVLPTPSSSSGQVFLSGLGLGRQERNIISEEQSRNREREQDLNMIKNLLGKF